MLYIYNVFYKKNEFIKKPKPPTLKKEIPSLTDIYSQVFQDDRVDRVFQNFFLRIKKKKNNGKTGYPRFKGFLHSFLHQKSLPPHI